jgi:activator of HSP90 ATPase
MFGIINPPNAYMQSTSVGMMMPSLAGQYPSTQAAMSYTSNVTANQSSAATWGMNIDMSSMPSWSQQYTAENVLFTRAFLGMNPETLSSDGSVDLSTMGSSAVMVPTDVAASMNNAGNSTSSSYGSPSSSSASSSASSAAASAVGGSSKSTNGAGVISSPRVAVALVAVVAAFFAL